MTAAAIRPENRARCGWKLKGHEAALLAAIAGGVGINELAFHYDCSTEAIRKFMRRHGVAPLIDRKRGSSLSPEACALCRTWHAKGWGARKIAAALLYGGHAEGTHSNLLRTVMRWRIGAGLPANGAGLGGSSKAAYTDDETFAARLHAKQAKEQAALGAMRRRCECGGIVAPGIAHQCRRQA